MNSLITPLIVFAVCSAVIFCYAALCLLKIKKLEREEKADINNFCVYLKRDKDSVFYFAQYFGVMPLVSIALIYNRVELIVIAVAVIMCVVVVMVGAVERIRQKLIIRENQITYDTFFGIKKVFDFESIKKVEIFSIRGFFRLPPKVIFTVQLPGSKNNYNIKFEYAGFEYNNMDLLMERLIKVGLIGANEITNKATVLENNQYSENDKFVVSRESDWVIYCLVLISLFLLSGAFMYPFLSGDFFVSVSLVLFLSMHLQRAAGKIVYRHNVIEYGFIFKKKFKIQDILHVKYIPHMNLVSAAMIILKDEKSTFTVYKDSKNFDLFFETLGHAGVVFK